MPSDTELLERMYDRFNARDIDAALMSMHRDVVWANGLEGGYVHGRDGVRAYWTRQWATIDSRAKPVGFSAGADGTIAVDVHLTARDRKGNLVFDKMAVHIFRIQDGLITRFDIREDSA
jgi:ketosteroid isomerase-like protein